MDFEPALALCATLLPASLAFILNYFSPAATANKLAWRAASAGPVIIAIYIVLFIAAGFAEPAPRTPLPRSEVFTGLALDAAAVVGTLIIGYLVARLMLTVLRRK